jgi:aminoglycoside phosphotransferase (APT) family kinase protein
MIRDGELSRYLECIAAELGGSIRSEVQTDYARKTIDSLLFVLGRLIGQIRSGEAIAIGQIDRWRQIQSDFAVLNSDHPSDDVSGDSLHRLDEKTSRLQSNLLDDATFCRLTDRLQSGDPYARDWLRTASATFNELMQAFENNYVRTPPRKGLATVADNVDDLCRRLSAYLKSRYPALPSNAVKAMAIAPGGQVKRVGLFEVPPNDILPQHLVLRQDMALSITGTSVSDEYRIIERVHGLGLPVPRPILLETAPDILGGPFMLMTQVRQAMVAAPFVEERRHLPPATGPDFGHELAGCLARLHRLTLEPSGASEEHQRLEQEEIRKMRETWQRQGKPAFSLSVDLGFAWTLSHPLPAGRPRCLIHGDAGLHNVLTRDGHLAALVDWELAKIADPAEDLAQVKMMALEDVMPWPAFAAAYIAQGGPAEACDERAISFYSIKIYLKHSILNNTLRDYFHQGSRDDAPAASIATHFIDRLSLYVARALDQAKSID